jgi:hypothetical protein
VATGTTNWSVASIPLQSGSNVITVTAFDAAGNQGTDSVTMTYSTGSTDSTRPTVSIKTPSFTTTNSTVKLTGTAADDRGVTQVRWANSRGGSGVATGTTSWSVPSLPLQGGANLIIVTAVDAAGNTGSDAVTITAPSGGSGGGGGGGGAAGLIGEYFSGRTFGTRRITRTDPSVGFEWGTGSPAWGMSADNFSARWTGQVKAPATGTYRFSTLSDDGVRLWVNGQLVIDNWTTNGERTNISRTVTLQAGVRYSIRLEYFEGTGNATIRLRWTPPGGASVTIPASALFH